MYKYTYMQVKNITKLMMVFNPVKASSLGEYSKTHNNNSPYESIVIMIVDVGNIIKQALPNKLEQQLFIDDCAGLNDTQIAYKNNISIDDISYALKRIRNKVKRYIKRINEKN